MHELCYYQEIHAVAPDTETLWQLKCRYVVEDSFQSPENLKIFFDGKNEWIFDYLPTKREASKILCEASLPTFKVAAINDNVDIKVGKND